MKSNNRKEGLNLDETLSTVDALSTNKKQFDLRRRYPLSLLAVVRRSVLWLVIYGIFAILIGWAIGESPKDPMLPNVNSTLQTICNALLIAGAIVCIGKLIYELFFHFFYYYGIEEGHLVVSSGILLKHRGAFPLASITDVYLDRGILDFFFGLYNVFSSNPAMDSHEYAEIHGLSKRHAIALQDYLVTLTHKISPKVQVVAEKNPPEKQPMPPPT